MNNKKIDDWFHQRLGEINNQYNADWVFGSEQFKAYEKKQRDLGYEGEFTSIPSFPGLILRKDNVQDWVIEYLSIQKEYKEKKRKSNKMDKYIEISMVNHEVYYTNDYLDINMASDVRSIFPEATDEDFMRVYDKTKKKHQID